MLTNLTSIPRIMRGMSWLNGATLLDNWFARPATAYPNYAAPDTTTIRLNSWALKYPRVLNVYNKLIQERIWSNPPAQRVIGQMLQKKGLLKTDAVTATFGSLADPVNQQDSDYINERPTGGYTDFDDVTAALGNFNIRVVVAGKVTFNAAQSHKAPLFDVEISEVGVYIRDSFDFSGVQYLGCWSENPDGFSPIMPPEEPSLFTPPLFTPVGNRSFREWRDKNKRGGDCLIFSDMNRIALNPPDKFLVTGPPGPT